MNGEFKDRTSRKISKTITMTRDVCLGNKAIKKYKKVAFATKVEVAVVLGKREFCLGHTRGGASVGAASSGFSLACFLQGTLSYIIL